MNMYDQLQQKARVMVDKLVKIQYGMYRYINGKTGRMWIG